MYYKSTTFLILAFLLLFLTGCPPVNLGTSLPATPTMQSLLPLNATTISTLDLETPVPTNVQVTLSSLTNTPVPVTVSFPLSTTISNPARIIVEGTGFAPDHITSPRERKQAALRAAETVAKLRLAEWINGTEVEGVTILEYGTLVTDTIKAIVRARVPAAKTISQVYDSTTGSATVTLELTVEEGPSP